VSSRGRPDFRQPASAKPAKAAALPPPGSRERKRERRDSQRERELRNRALPLSERPWQVARARRRARREHAIRAAQHEAAQHEQEAP